MKYGYAKTTNLPFDAAIAKITDELKKEGFGVLTTIDVQETLKKKLNADFPPYVILGACNPPFAHQTLQIEEEIGLLLPCNVIVYRKGESTVVAAFNPEVMAGIVDNDKLPPIAAEVGARLRRAVDAVA